MPPFGSTPYAPDPRDRYDDSASAARITDIIMKAGQARARAAEQQGQIWGSTVSGLGAMAGDVIGQRQEQKAIAKRDQALIELMGRPDATPQDFASVAGPKLGLETYAAVQAFNKTKAGVSREEAARLLPIQLKVFRKLTPEARQQLYPALRENSIKVGLFGEQDAPPEYTPDLDSTIEALESAFGGEKKLEKVTRREGGKEITEFVEPTAGLQITSELEPPKPISVGGSLVQVGPGGGVTELYRAPEKPAGPGAHSWVMRDGQPVRVSESEIRPGDVPYESARTGQKKIPAGEAATLADYKSGLDEVGAIRAEIATGEPGIISRIGAAIPGATKATAALTGGAVAWGEDAKAREATIAKVKQIIGKSLEGGVLRKEDEYKYKAILPEMGDSKKIVAAKLDGLEASVRRKRDNALDAFADAGYDVSGFDPSAGLSANETSLLKEYGF